jgi:hypothetical protein
VDHDTWTASSSTFMDSLSTPTAFGDAVLPCVPNFMASWVR